MLRAFAKKDSRMIILEQPHKGAGAARNTGLDIARGEYLSFLDADDLFEPNMIEIAYNAAKSSLADMIIFDADIFDSGAEKKLPSNWIINKAAMPNDGIFSADNVRSEIFTICSQVAWNRLFSAKYVAEHQFHFQEIEKHNDSYFSVMTLIHAKRIRYIDAIMLHYRQGTQTQISSSLIGKRDYFSVIDAMIAIHSEIQTMDSYGEMLKSFLNYSSNLMLTVFRQIKQKDYFRIFALVKEQWISRFPKEVFCEDYFKIYAEYCQMASIIENDAIGHLFTLLSLKNQEIERFNLNKRWFFFDERVKNGCDIVLYGAGEIGVDYYRQFSDSNQYHVAAWLDVNYMRYHRQGLPVKAPNELSGLRYDWVIIAVINRSTAEQIKHSLLGYGVPEDRLIWPFEGR
jgi:glycosyltransferase involved in cell wall biosynthesis